MVSSPSHMHAFRALFLFQRNYVFRTRFDFWLLFLTSNEKRGVHRRRLVWSFLHTYIQLIFVKKEILSFRYNLAPISKYSLCTWNCFCFIHYFSVRFEVSLLFFKGFYVKKTKWVISELCVKAMHGLNTSGLISMDEACCIQSTDAGRIMSVYYINVGTMKDIMKVLLIYSIHGFYF